MAKGSANLQQNNFIKIGTVNSGGNSAQSQSYNFIDNEPGKSDIRYYRLKIIHNEGVYSYSTIKPVIFDNALIGGIFPNPTNGVFNLTFQAVTGEKIQAKLFDAKGRILRNAETIGTGDIQKFVIDISDERIPAGVYMVRVNLGTIIKSYRVIKQ
jgi:hypothetical protein